MTTFLSLPSSLNFGSEHCHFYTTCSNVKVFVLCPRTLLVGFILFRESLVIIYFYLNTTNRLVVAREYVLRKNERVFIRVWKAVDAEASKQWKRRNIFLKSQSDTVHDSKGATWFPLLCG